ncbi:hypothetical protein Y032_0652g1159 [Ancylostoma ceylanicum]|uniref:BPTI/Kunitz inhibitor domain-containing protein n=1 Tax=Ancylostoma ceylanicum TaxID=53326 RepID=A0A016WKK3_9BILA|nr:hypothetical protein Y032_0652g1159 [Ancylostoma ceylanicum]
MQSPTIVLLCSTLITMGISGTIPYFGDYAEQSKRLEYGQMTSRGRNGKTLLFLLGGKASPNQDQTRPKRGNRGIWTVRLGGSPTGFPSKRIEKWTLIIPIGPITLPIPTVQGQINGTNGGQVPPQPPASSNYDQPNKGNNGQQSPQHSTSPKSDSVDSRNYGHVSLQPLTSPTNDRSREENKGTQSPQLSPNPNSVDSRKYGHVSPQPPTSINYDQSKKGNNGKQSPQLPASPNPDSVDSRKYGQQPPQSHAVPNPNSLNSRNSGTGNACFAPIDPGMCRGQVTRYGYDPKQNRCFPFRWTGCGGNKNRFITVQKCELACRV